MDTKVKILACANGVTKVTEISGERQGDDLFIERDPLGTPGAIVEVPEFEIEDFESRTASRFYGEGDYRL